MTQTASETQLALDAFVALLRAHGATTRDLSVRLQNEHGLTINDYEALLLLSRSEGERQRRVDLAEQLMLTASGITRLLEGLESAGYVDRAVCDTDRRVTYAVLTEAGRKKLEEASCSHVAAIREVLEERFDEAELEQLATLLARLGRPGDAACDVPRS